MGNDDRYPPIGDHGFLTDCHSWALVTRDGTVDWLCFEHAGGHAAFARLLDRDRGGGFEVRVEGADRTSHRYLDDTNVLETRFETDDGVVTVTDALLVDARETSGGVHEADPYGQLLRSIRCESGRADVTAHLDPRFDYGLTSTHVRVHDDTTATVLGGADALLVHSQIPLEQDDWSSCGGRDTLQQGDERLIAISYQLPHGLEVTDLDADELGNRLDATIAFWRDWAGCCAYDGPYRDHVVRSALVLKGLADARTGAIIAAATTSLPEEIGGVRNWDYRFTWIRDAAWHLNALFGLGYEHEAQRFMGWVSRTTAGTADDLQVMYGNTGRRLIRERELDGLEGYRGSAPVRIGNGATRQFQLDLYGELVNAAWHYHRRGGCFSHELRHLLQQIVDVVEARWQDPDRGIWEVRGAPEQFVSSKLYAWLAVDRLLRLADAGAVEIDGDRAERLRTVIRDHIEHHGFSQDDGHVLRTFGRPGVDASSLLLVLEGFVEPDDPRVDATLERILDELAVGVDGGVFLHRYRTDDGLSGEQNTFWWCSFWLVSVLVMRGEVDRARQLFERLLEATSELGLLSEEVDPRSGELLGNFPQAISHVGLIDAALRLHDADPA